MSRTQIPDPPEDSVDVEERLRLHYSERSAATPEWGGSPAAIRAAAAQARRRSVAAVAGTVLAAAAITLAVIATRGLPTAPLTPAVSSALAGPRLAGLCADPSTPGRDISTYDRLPDSLGPVTAAYVCVTRTERVPGDGVWQVVEARKVIGGLDSTLAAYRAPDATATPGQFCLSVGYGAHLLHLVTGAGVVTAREPMRQCRRPDDGAAAAFAAMQTQLAVATRVGRVQTELSVTSGCDDGVKDMVAIESTRPVGVSHGPIEVVAARGKVMACVYASDHGTIPVGTLVQAKPVPGTVFDVVRAELAKAGPGARCDGKAHTHFVHFVNVSDPGFTEIALDGCGVSQGNVGFQSGTDRLREALNGVLGR